MIYESLSYVARELNQTIRSRLNVNENKVALSAIISQDGSVPIEAEDKILLTLVNIEHETAMSRNVGNGILARNQPMHFNLYVMFSASFRNSNYEESLKFISFIIGYFQSQPNFTKGLSSGMPNGVDRMTFEIVNQGLQEMHNLWGAIGAKYMPSILYKVRVLTFDEGTISKINIPVRGVDTEGTSKAD